MGQFVKDLLTIRIDDPGLLPTLRVEQYMEPEDESAFAGFNFTTNERVFRRLTTLPNVSLGHEADVALCSAIGSSRPPAVIEEYKRPADGAGLLNWIT